MTTTLHLTDTHLVRSSSVNLCVLFDEMRDYIESLGEERIETLYLNGNSIRSLSADLIPINDRDETTKQLIVKSIANLKSLHLNENEIENLDLSLLLNIINLQFLNLSNNEIHSISNDNMTVFKTITTLDLSFNKLQNLNGLSCCIRLKELLVDHNMITSVEDMKDVFEMSELVTLDFRDNNIEEDGALHILQTLVMKCPKITFLNGSLLKTRIKMKHRRRGSRASFDNNNSMTTSSSQVPINLDTNKNLTTNINNSEIRENPSGSKRDSLKKDLFNDQKLITNLAAFAAKQQKKKSPSDEYGKSAGEPNGFSKPPLSKELTVRPMPSPSSSNTYRQRASNSYNFTECEVSDTEPIIHEDEAEELEYLNMKRETGGNSRVYSSAAGIDAEYGPASQEEEFSTVDENGVTIRTTKRYMMQQRKKKNRIEVVERIEKTTVRTPTIDRQERERFAREPPSPFGSNNSTQIASIQIETKASHQTMEPSPSHSGRQPEIPKALQALMQSRSSTHQVQVDGNSRLAAFRRKMSQRADEERLKQSCNNGDTTNANVPLKFHSIYHDLEEKQLACIDEDIRTLNMKELARSKMKERLKNLSSLSIGGSGSNVDYQM